MTLYAEGVAALRRMPSALWHPVTAERRLCTRYDFRCTIRTTAPLRAHAQRAAEVADAAYVRC